jgi:hypothetical protein
MSVHAMPALSSRLALLAFLLSAAARAPLSQSPSGMADSGTRNVFAPFNPHPPSCRSRVPQPKDNRSSGMYLAMPNPHPPSTESSQLSRLRLCALAGSPTTGGRKQQRQQRGEQKGTRERLAERQKGTLNAQKRGL